MVIQSMNPFEMLEKLIADIMREARLPGLSIGVVAEGEIVYVSGFGSRNLEDNSPMTPDTLFGIGSIGKSFTAMAIMQLVEQGKIDLDAPANKYIDLKLGTEENPIKIHHMLSHSSGIPALGGAIIAITRGIGDFTHLVPYSSEKDFLLHINGAQSEAVENDYANP